MTSSETLFVKTTVDTNFNCSANYTPIFFDSFTFENNSALEGAAAGVCGSDRTCLYDIAATGSTQFGATTRSSLNTILTENDVIGK